MTVLEVRGGAPISAKQFIRDAVSPVEERDGSGNLLAQYFEYGQVNYTGATATNYFYTLDHLGSVRETTDSGSTVQAGYSYDPFGRSAKISGSLSSDFQYAGYYFHAPSGLSLTLSRAYSPNFGRWINRDRASLGETNLYQYCDNDPIGLFDPAGDKGQKPTGPSRPRPSVPPAPYTPTISPDIIQCFPHLMDPQINPPSRTFPGSQVPPPPSMPKPLPEPSPKPYRGGGLVPPPPTAAPVPSPSPNPAAPLLSTPGYGPLPPGAGPGSNDPIQ